jgi:hypothetical protein
VGKHWGVEKRARIDGMWMEFDFASLKLPAQVARNAFMIRKSGRQEGNGFKER